MGVPIGLSSGRRTAVSRPLSWARITGRTVIPRRSAPAPRAGARVPGGIGVPGRQRHDLESFHRQQEDSDQQRHKW